MSIQERYINPFTDFGFKKLRFFEAAEIAKFSVAEKEEYEDSVKVYRDLKNVIDTARSEAKTEGVLLGERQKMTEGIIELLKLGKLTIREIAQVFRTTVEVVLEIKQQHNL